MIIFDSSARKKRPHPAIDVVDGTLYYGVLLPTRGEDEDVVDSLCFVTSKGEVLSPDEISKRNISPKYADATIESRWAPELVKRYLDTRDGYKEILADLRQAFKDFIFLLNEKEYSFLALWVLGTYLMPLWDAYPYLDIVGIRRTGKTHLIRLLEQVSFNSILSISATGPSLFRIVQAMCPTVLVDEAEKFSGEPERVSEIRNLLLAGYKKGGYAIRTEGTEKKIPRRFRLFSPKAIVSIQGLEEFLMDRSIQLLMCRAPKGDPRARRPIREGDPRWSELRHRLYSFALVNWGVIKDLYDRTEEFGDIEAREFEIWKPILVLAKYLGVFDEVLELVREKIGKKQYEDVMETRELLLLRALVPFVREDDFYKISDIRREVLEREFEEEPRWLTTDWIGRALSRLGFTQKSKKSKYRYRRLTASDVRRSAKLHGVNVEGILEQEKEKPIDEPSVFELVGRGTPWEDVFEKLTHRGFSNAEELFIKLGEREKRAPFSFHERCEFESSERRTENGRRMCMFSGVSTCGVTDPKRCPIGKKIIGGRKDEQ